MKKVNRKRLNNKGFTLIELLAVVVILSIVMGITGNAVLNSINNSRISTLHSTAQNAANTLNTWISEDMLVLNNGDRKLGDAFITATQGSGTKDTWICLDTLVIMNAASGTPSKKLTEALSLSTADFITSNDKYKNASNREVKAAAPTSGTTYTIDNSTNTKCSAVRYNSSISGYEILLVAKSGGKYFVTSKNNNYAFSRATASGVNITD